VEETRLHHNSESTLNCRSICLAYMGVFSEDFIHCLDRRVAQHFRHNLSQILQCKYLKTHKKPAFKVFYIFISRKCSHYDIKSLLQSFRTILHSPFVQQLTFYKRFPVKFHMHCLLSFLSLCPAHHCLLDVTPIKIIKFCVHHTESSHQASITLDKFGNH
jgi:hypothetical protein